MSIGETTAAEEEEAEAEEAADPDDRLRLPPSDDGHGEAASPLPPPTAAFSSGSSSLISTLSHSEESTEPEAPDCGRDTAIWSGSPGGAGAVTAAEGMSLTAVGICPPVPAAAAAAAAAARVLCAEVARSMASMAAAVLGVEAALGADLPAPLAKPPPALV